MSEFPQAPPPPVRAQKESSPEQVGIAEILVAEWTREAIVTVADTAPRSMQLTVGPSELGQRCRRRMAYRIAGTPLVNVTDPLKASMGIGMHHVMATGLARLDPARYMIEQRVTYRGISGSCDLYDRLKRRVVDWKTTSAKRITRYRREGVPHGYVTQINVYAAALAAMGWPVEQVALVFIPRDGDLTDVYAWVAEPDAGKADAAIDTHEQLQAELEAGATPADIEAWPSVLCNYCPNYAPRAVDLALACPGKAIEK